MVQLAQCLLPSVLVQSWIKARWKPSGLPVGVLLLTHRFLLLHNASQMHEAPDRTSALSQGISSMPKALYAWADASPWQVWAYLLLVVLDEETAGRKVALC